MLPELSPRWDHERATYSESGAALVNYVKLAALVHVLLAGGQIDLLLQLPLAGVSLLDFEKVEPVATAGRELAEPLLDAWLEERPDVPRRT